VIKPTRFPRKRSKSRAAKTSIPSMHGPLFALGMVWFVGANWHPVKKAAPEVMKERREDMIRMLKPRHQKSNT